MPLASTTAIVVGALLVVAYLACGVVTVLKRKWGSLIVGFFFVPVWIVAAIRLARPGSWWARRFYDESKLARGRSRAGSRPYRAAVVVALASPLVVVATLLGLFDFYRIPGSAMEATLRCARPNPGCSGEASDRVLALRYLPGTTPGRGDLVVFRTPSEAESICPGPGGVFVQRLIGLPGDLLEISDRVYVNSEPLDEPYLNGGRVGDRFGPVTVPDDRYFVMGDNRYQSCDSREYGAVPREDILSHVVFRYGPLDRIGLP